MSKEIENLEDWVSKLKDCNKLIVVEGKKDKAALNKLGIRNIRTLKNPLYKEVEDIAASCKEVVILTDLDKEGKQLYGKIKKDLVKNGVKVDNRFREFLFKKTKLRQIEGICTYLENSHSL